jgi:hypothetical protein
VRRIEKEGPVKILRILKWTLMALAVLFIGAQFVRPARTNPPVEQAKALGSEAPLPEQVASVFKRACNDCHSNETVWPWYSNVAPASWFLIDHVNDGRRHLNFSEWARYNPREAGELLEEICKEVKRGGMPLNSYLLLHPEARLSDEDRETLCDWANAERQRLALRSK